MKDPVVASDGLTYEKNAIEKWLCSQSKTDREGSPVYTSPLTGASLPSGNLLFPNVNLRNLIQDFIKEGGTSLYCHDMQDTSRLVEVVPSSQSSSSSSSLLTSSLSSSSPSNQVRQEKVLVLKCLGPPDSDWNQRSFHVSRYGCIGTTTTTTTTTTTSTTTSTTAITNTTITTTIGGRKPTIDKDDDKKNNDHNDDNDDNDDGNTNDNDDDKQRDYICFKENVISRKHFEIKRLGVSKFGIRYHHHHHQKQHHHHHHPHHHHHHYYYYYHYHYYYYYHHYYYHYHHHHYRHHHHHHHHHQRPRLIMRYLYKDTLRSTKAAAHRDDDTTRKASIYCISY